MPALPASLSRARGAEAANFNGGLFRLELAVLHPALQAVVDSLDGKEVNPVVDSDKIGPVPALINKEVLDDNPDFKGEWQG